MMSSIPNVFFIVVDVQNYRLAILSMLMFQGTRIVIGGV